MSRDVAGTIDRDDVMHERGDHLPSRGAGRGVMVVAAIASVDANRSVIRFCSSIALFRSFSSRTCPLHLVHRSPRDSRDHAEVKNARQLVIWFERMGGKGWGRRPRGPKGLCFSGRDTPGRNRDTGCRVTMGARQK